MEVLLMLNHITIMGRLVRDPELRRTNSGKAVTSFTIACDKPGRDSGTSFIECVAWEKTADFIDNYFMKGSAILLEGRLESRQYETKDNQKRTVHEVVVSQAHFCEKKKEETDAPKMAPASFEPLTNNDPLPF
jgi:single-strand DNA-binding protein